MQLTRPALPVLTLAAAIPTEADSVDDPEAYPFDRGQARRPRVDISRGRDVEFRGLIPEPPR